MILKPERFPDISMQREHGTLNPRLSNLSASVGKRILFVGSVAKDNAIFVLDRSNQPTRPYRNNMYEMPGHIVPVGTINPWVRELDNEWEVTIDFGDVRPQEQVWTDSALLIGSRDGITKMEGKLQGDNIPEPVPCMLEVNFEIEKRPMNRSDVEPHLERC